MGRHDDALVWLAPGVHSLALDGALRLVMEGRWPTSVHGERADLVQHVLTEAARLQGVSRG